MSEKIVIEQISLLSAVVFNAYHDCIPKTLTEGYWLKTPETRFRKRAKIVIDGTVISQEVFKKADVRPLVKIRAKSAQTLFPKTQMELCGLKWTVLKNTVHTAYLITNDVIASRTFDIVNNDWNTSELKAWLEEWVEYIVLGNDNVEYKPVTKR